MYRIATFKVFVPTIEVVHRWISQRQRARVANGVLTFRRRHGAAYS
jgi:hypothetical protein